jgi:3-isopropylmalate dehydrogenase
VDKANVLDTSRLWRETATRVFADEFPDLELEHLYVDAAAMHLLARPAEFDIMVMDNMFGDILTDEASMLAGSLGLLPSASTGESTFGLYEPIHGSAPDIAGQDKANPIGAMLSMAMMLRYSLELPEAADLIETAVHACLKAGLRTADLGGGANDRVLGTQAFGDAVIAEINATA